MQFTGTVRDPPHRVHFLTRLVKRPPILALLLLCVIALRGDTVPIFPVHAGLRISRGKHLSPFPSARYFESASAAMAAKTPRAKPCLIWIVGLYWRDGEMGVSFPKPDSARGDFPFVHFINVDLNETYLSEFDRRGIDVWLEVEPGNANVETLIDLVLSRYGHHRCVVGFGVDVEWFRRGDRKDGRPVTDAEARDWDRRVKSFNPRFRLFLKHYMPNRMPPTVRGDLLFLDDSQGFQSLRAMTHEFRLWGRKFYPAEVGYQFGYPSDEAWWSRYSDPARTITAELRDYVPNARWFFWVDFTVLDVFPDREQ